MNEPDLPMQADNNDLQLHTIILAAIKPLATTALAYLIPILYHRLFPNTPQNQYSILEETLPNESTQQTNPDQIFDIALKNLLSNLDQSDNKKEVILGFINDNFNELADHHHKDEITNNIKEFLSSTDQELMLNPSKNSVLHKFFNELKASSMPKTIEKVAKIVSAKKMSDIILKHTFGSGYMNHLCFNQDFAILNLLLGGVDVDLIGAERVKSLTEVDDTAHLQANILECASIMSSVAPKEFLKNIIDLYSQFYPQDNLRNNYLMLNPDYFKRIFTTDRFETFSDTTLQKAINKLSKITPDFALDQMRDVDLHPYTLHRDTGYEVTTLEKQTFDMEELYEALNAGKAISIKDEGLRILEYYFFKHNSVITEDMRDRILAVKGFRVGIVTSAIGDQESIGDVVKENVNENKKYMNDILERILEKRRQEPSTKPSSTSGEAQLTTPREL